MYTQYSPEAFIPVYKERSHHLLIHAYLGFDKPLIPVLIALNNKEGIATSFSCEGNHKESPKGKFYILMVANETGYQTLVNIFDKLVSSLISAGILNKFTPSLESKTMIDCVCSDPTDIVYYKAYCLLYRNHGTQRNIAEKQLFLDLLLNAINESK